MNYADRLKQLTTSTGTGNLVLGAAPVGYLPLNGAFTGPGRFLYVIQDSGPGQWEIGWGYVSAGSLVRETPIAGSSSLPVSLGAGTKEIFVAHNAVLSTGMHMALFGSGIGGNGAITTGVSQAGDGHYENLTISGAGSIDAAGHRVLVRGILDLQSAGFAAINNNGELGATAVLDALGTGGQGGLSGTLGAGTSGGNGAVGAAGAGAVGAAGSALVNSNGGQGGHGGQGGDSGGGVLGGASKATGSVSGAQTPGIFDSLVGDAAGTGLQILGGGSGGGGGSAGGGAGGGKGGAGGGAGGGGGVLEVRAAMLILGNGTAAVAAIAAVGGSGGKGGAGGGVGNSGGGGGGAGGGGGYVRLIVGYVRGAKEQLVAAFGGSGGDGGAGASDGLVGRGGDGGNGGIVDIWNLETGTMVRTNGSSGLPHNVGLGGLGGACYGDL